jgi:hypothetical protein
MIGNGSKQDLDDSSYKVVHEQLKGMPVAYGFEMANTATVWLLHWQAAMRSFTSMPAATAFQWTLATLMLRTTSR